MCVRILAALACCAALMASGQNTKPSADARPISLSWCIDVALSRNLDLRIEHLITDAAGYNLAGAYGAYSPIFTVGGQHAYASDPGDFDARKFNDYYPVDLNTDTLGTGLNGQLPMGLSYGLNVTTIERDARTDFNSDPSNAVYFADGIRQTNNYFAETGLTLRQHLLKDFWIDAARQTLLMRRKELGMSQQALRFQVMRTVLAVEVSYYDLIAAREMIKVREKAVELKQQLVDETRRRVEVGDLPPLDSEQAETQLENALTALIGAREDYMVRENGLKRLLTDDFKEWADYDLQPTEALLALPAEINRSESFQRAMKNRPDLLEARLAIERSAVVVKFQYNQLFPNLDLVGHYGGVGVNADYNQALDQAFNFSNPQYFYGVVLSFPLSNATERGKYHASKAAKQIAELQLKKAEQEVLVQIADCVNRVQSRFSQVSSTRKARSFAEAALAAEQKKLQNGLSTSFFVLQLQETLTAAQTAELRALTDYNQTLAQLAFAEGSTLAKHHLALEGIESESRLTHETP
jgi:outer membrane protein TolC